MKRLLIALLFAAVSFSLAAQEDAEYLKDLLLNNRVSFKYSLGVKGSAPVVMSGNAVIDGNCYSARGRGIELYCDGKTKWVVDKEAKEVYVEPSGGTSDFLSNPSAWIDRVTDLKVLDNTATGYYYDDSQDVVLSFRFYSLNSSPLSGSSKGFVFDTSSLGPEWVVTDLR